MDALYSSCYFITSHMGPLSAERASHHRNNFEATIKMVGASHRLANSYKLFIAVCTEVNGGGRGDPPPPPPPPPSAPPP
eukprot:5123031-Pleurochrysis_carterae.AAC.1